MSTLHELRNFLLKSMPHNAKRITSPQAIAVEGCGRALLILPPSCGTQWIAYLANFSGPISATMDYVNLEYDRFESLREAVSFANGYAQGLQRLKAEVCVRRAVAEALRIATKKRVPFSTVAFA